MVCKLFDLGSNNHPSCGLFYFREDVSSRPFMKVLDFERNGNVIVDYDALNMIKYWNNEGRNNECAE